MIGWRTARGLASVGSKMIRSAVLMASGPCSTSMSKPRSVRRVPPSSAHTVQAKAGSPKWERSVKTLRTTLNPNELTPCVANAITDRKGLAGMAERAARHATALLRVTSSETRPPSLHGSGHRWFLSGKAASERWMRNIAASPTIAPLSVGRIGWPDAGHRLDAVLPRGSSRRPAELR